MTSIRLSNCKPECSIKVFDSNADRVVDWKLNNSSITTNLNTSTSLFIEHQDELDDGASDKDDDNADKHVSIDDTDISYVW